MNTPHKSTDKTSILTRAEIANVLADLKRKRRLVNTRQNLVIFRLSACCGLRVSEISDLRIRDVQTEGRRPQIVIPETAAKRWRPRTVPLWWDADTLADIEVWKGERIAAGAKPSDPLVCSQHRDTLGKTLSARNLQHRWSVAIKILGKDRVKRLSIQKGRHSFWLASPWRKGERSLRFEKRPDTRTSQRRTIIEPRWTFSLLWHLYGGKLRALPVAQAMGISGGGCFTKPLTHPSRRALELNKRVQSVPARIDWHAVSRRRRSAALRWPIAADPQRR